MVRKGLLVLLWFPITMTMLILNLALLSSLRVTHTETPVRLSAIAPHDGGFMASSGMPQVLSAEVIAGDARTLLLESFLRKHSSPMSPYADLIVKQADANGFDFRLVPAIAMCESNLGKHVPLKAGFNPFGIAVYTGTQKGKNFDSWDHAIEWVSKYIHDRYYAQGITDLKEIGAIWAPPSVETGYSWSNCVEFFQNSIL